MLCLVSEGWKSILTFKRCRGQERSACESEGKINLKGEEYASVFLHYSHSNSIFTTLFCSSSVLYLFAFSPLNASHVTTGCPCSSTIIFHHIVSFCPTLIASSQFPKLDPGAHQLTWECLGRGLSWRQSSSEGRGLGLIPTSAQCCLDGAAAPGADRKVLGESRSVPVVNAV